MKSDTKQKLDAIEELHNYLMRELTTGEIQHIMSAPVDKGVSEILESLSLEGTNKEIFETIKNVVSSFFTDSDDRWGKFIKSLDQTTLKNVIDRLNSIVTQLNNFVLTEDHLKDGYDDEIDPELKKFFEDKESTSDLDTYLTHIENQLSNPVDSKFDKLLAGKEIEMSEEDFDKIADKFFSEDREGCWSLIYDNGKVRMAYTK